jgi:3-oxoacyl-(acyl-carrier-protein) synthase
MRVNKELCYYKKVWNIENIPDVSSSITNEEKTNLVIFSDDDQWYYEFHKNNFEYVSKFQGINNEDSINSFIKTYNELPNYRKQIIIVLEQVKFSDKITEDYIHSLFAPVLKLSKFIISKKEKNVQWIIVNPCTFNSENPYYDALEGFFKTLITEHPDHQVMIVNTQYRDKLQIVQNIKLELSRNSDIFSHIAFHNNKRFVMKYKFENIKNKKAVLRQNGTYLITGGTGGIGKTIARFLCDEFSANVILVGRRKENSEIRNFLSETMNVTEGKICYFSCDIADEKSDLELIRNVNLQFGKINGVFHCAGVTNDCFILNKEIDNVKEVFDSKITGLVSLEKSLENNNLDFMILFSSLSSATGNMGQCDYAYANAFLDAYSIWKSSQNTERITLSLNWPLWEDGGMQVSDEIIEYLKNSIGLFAINKECGAKAIVQTLGTSGGNYIIGYGDVVKIKDKMEKIFCKKNINVEADKNKSEILIKKTQELISDIFSDVFKIKKSQVLIRKKFQDYGVDSIIVEKFNIKLEEILGPMPKTLLFEYNSIESLSVYLAEEYKNVLNNYFNVNKKDVFNNKLNEKSWKKLTPIKEQIIKKGNACKKNCDIAIIGMSFDFPGASNEDELWDLLSQGKSAVTEIPHNRFEWNDLFEEDPILASKEGKIYCKWGGFIHDVDKFDALFFNVMPKDAQSMDPQERLFLMHSWKAIEDAGYSRKRLKKVKCGQTESAVGVFAATTSNTYQFYGTEAWKNGSKVIPSSLEWSLANRVSYVMDLHGPSMPVDTACSSGLVAVHLACESLKNDKCSMAIAGGVNLYLHPMKYVAMCQMQMISKSGVCSAFGSNADGFVPGEGIGVIVLKKLEDAKRDKDHIYGIIKGSSVNHGGSTNGYTVPNPNAQSLVIQDALKKASVNARDISYVEAHGTGTILGDPIEIRGITDAYRKTTNDNQFCSIGSIKTNMGHLEGAAGIASIIKVLLQMKHKKLFPSLNAEELNPNIDFENSPFYVQKELSDWEGKTSDNIKNDKIRLSGVSSFGAGGANCHLIMQDYQDVSDENIHNNIVDNKNEKYLFILSAKTSKALREYASEFYKYILSLKKIRTILLLKFQQI